MSLGVLFSTRSLTGSVLNLAACCGANNHTLQVASSFLIILTFIYCLAEWLLEHNVSEAHSITYFCTYDLK